MMKPRNIRPLKDTDEAVVRKWLTTWLEDHIAGWTGAHGLNWSRNDIKSHIAAQDLVRRDWCELVEAFTDAGRLVQVAVIDADPVGIVHAECRLDRYLAQTIGVISWLYVAPAYRRRGISKELLTSAHQWMRIQGLLASEVFVTAGNSDALSTYRHAGYAVLDHRAVAALRNY